MDPSDFYFSSGHDPGPAYRVVLLLTGVTFADISDALQHGLSTVSIRFEAIYHFAWSERA